MSPITMIALYLLASGLIFTIMLVNARRVADLRPALGRRIVLVYLTPAEFLFVIWLLIFEAMDEPEGWYWRATNELAVYGNWWKETWDGY